MKMRVSGVLCAALFITVSFTACKTRPDLQPGMYAELETSKGTILVELAYQKVPLAVANFVGLCEGTLDAAKGKKFYNGLTFHRVEPGFVIQGGDPAGNGTGGPGYVFPNEIDQSLTHDRAGTLAWANRGPNSNGCQFYITLAATPALDGSYTVFGYVVEGMDVAKKISVGDVIKTVSIMRIGGDAKKFKTNQNAWNEYYSKASENYTAKEKADREASKKALMAVWPGLEERPDHILSKVIAEGKGQKAFKGCLAEVHYKGMLPSGTVFDQSILHGGPFKFELGTGKVILGWDKIVSEMRKGEKRLVAIPPELAYGARGVPGVIPPNSYLVFELELVTYSD